jgi:glycosyltransferase involved in cell wall biosynthesis
LERHGVWKAHRIRWPGYPGEARMTAELPLVSILTPSFNQARWLPCNLRSVACQTYPRVQHLVMDGGSTDGSVEILREAGDSIVWRSEPDSGQSDAVNKAFALSSGDIIGWINSDDAYFDCRVVEDVVRFLVRHPTVDVVYGHAAYVNADGTILRMIWVPWFIRSIFRITNFVGQPVVFARRRVLTDPMLDVTYNFAMDYELWLRMEDDGYQFRRIDRINAIDRYQPGRKSETSRRILDADLERLTEAKLRRAEPRAGRLLAWLFNFWRRLMGIRLVFQVPRDLAFTDVRTDRWELLRRQALPWGLARLTGRDSHP